MDYARRWSLGRDVTDHAQCLVRAINFQINVSNRKITFGIRNKQRIESVADKKFDFITSISKDIHGFLVGCSQQGLPVNLDYPLTNLNGNLSQTTQFINIQSNYLNSVVF